MTAPESSKPLKIAAGVVGVVAGIVAIVAAFKNLPEHAEQTTVSADRGAIAAGNDVRVQGDTVVSQHDFDADAREEAMRYARVSGVACQELKAKVESLQPDSSFSPHELATLMPVQLQPHPELATQFGDEAMQTLEAKLKAVTDGNIALMKPLITNSFMAGLPQSERRKAQQARQLEEFPALKSKQLASIGELRSYLDGLRARG